MRPHIHKPAPTGREIRAIFGKDNLPEGLCAVTSFGMELICLCGERFIRHDASLLGYFAEEITALHEIESDEAPSSKG